ncbi:flavin monoamine oxidase family protein [Agromyces silvae]|uniref:flavin monoamine oxidase family protein n=1 Tax=Agromyces silvae TaxID=3388266 RepID=UPI00280B4DC2|nr:NAD(P)/FAD-dependent oxidoreductase [Agromyces protaetiae]
MTKTVAIIGAGAAGLMAALDLRAAGYEPVVLESRRRVGGRIHTVHFADGTWANAGAEWLNSGDLIARALAERYGLDLLEVPGFEALAENGRLVSDDGALATLDAALEDLVSHVSDAAEPWNDPFLRTLDERDVAEWACSVEADSATRRRFFRHIRGNYMTQPDELSLAAYVVESSFEGVDRRFRLRDGTASLPQAMAQDLGSDRIHLGNPVLSIAHTVDGAVVSTAGRSWRVDAVVVAVPLIALDRIEVTPALSVPRIAGGRGGKLLVPYARRAWDAPVHASGGLAPMAFVYETAPHQPGAGGVLAAYSVDPLAPAAVVRDFARWFPDAVPASEPPHAVWWSLDPDSGLTYSAPQPGYLTALRDLQLPQGRIHFAGEHTQPLFGYVESALLSGRRAASAVASQLDG